MGVAGIAFESADGGAPRGGAGAVAGEEEGLETFLRRRGAVLIGLINNASVASATTGRTRTDDFLDAEMGKHDYDWLLTPPGTPKFSSSDASKSQLIPTSTKNPTTVKSSSTARASRLSLPESENAHSSTKPLRSSSVNRPSVSTIRSNSSFNNKTSSLNTSTTSATSRHSTPSRLSTNGSRPVPASSARSSAISRPVQARSVNPAKTRPNLTSTNDKPRPLQSSRPSTPTGRPQPPSTSATNLKTSAIRPTSRPSTPTSRPKTPVLSSSPAITAGRSPSSGRLPASRSSGPSSRPSSPGLRTRAPVSSIDPTLFSHEAPPNLRTKLPERPASAGRTRPGMATTVRASPNAEVPASARSGSKHLLPGVARNKLPSKSDLAPVLHEIQKAVVSPEPGGRRASKAGLSESSGFGRTISKTSLDMALKHMDIRQSIGGIRANMIFPHSIRPRNAPKSRSARGADSIVVATNNDMHLPKDDISENGHEEKPMNEDGLIVNCRDVDLYGSSRYDTMLLKDDSMNTSWLHNFEDKSNQSPIFDRRFDPPPEPFSQL